MHLEIFGLDRFCFRNLNHMKASYTMGSCLNKRNILKHQDIFALLCFLATIIFLIWKAPYSYGLDDESYFLTFTHRLLLGDSFIVDEWYKGQFFGFLLFLPMKVYIHFIGSTEGMILFFRYFFAVFQSTVSAVIYFRLREYGMFGILAAVINILHIPFTFMIMSYNTMGFAFVVLIGVFLATAKKQSKLTLYFVGLFIACAVLCNPLLMLLYFVYCVFVFISIVSKNKKNRLLSYLETSISLKTWFWITLGISTLAVIFLAYLFSKTSFKAIIDNFPMLFTAPKSKFSLKEYQYNDVVTFQKSLLIIFKFSPYLYSAYGILMTVITFDKKRIKHRHLYLDFASVFYFAFIAQIILSPILPDQGYFYWMIPLSLVGLTCYSLSEYKNKKIFACLWLLGFLYAICVGIGSDIAQLTLPFGLGVSDIASVIFIKILIDEMRKQKISEKLSKEFKFKAITAILIAVLLVQIGSELYINADLTRYTQEYAFVDYLPSTAKAAKLNSIIETGPLKGVKTTANTVKLYNEMIKDLNIILKNSKKEDGYGPVLVTGYFPWCYLYLSMPYATFSTELLNYIDNQQLPKYYELHPDKVPKYIYVPKFGKITIENIPEWMNKELMYDSANDILADISKNYSCTIIEGNVGYIIEINN